MSADPRVLRVPVAPDVSLNVLDWRPAQVALDEPTYLLVHGLASNARLWDGVAMALQHQGRRVLAVDLRGHGHSDKPDDGYEMASVADDVDALIGALDLDRPIVAGQSWGANVVVELAARHPGRARGIVAVDGGFIELSSKFDDWKSCKERLAPPRFAGTPYVQFEKWGRDAHRDWPESGITGALANVEVRPDGTVAPWLTFERHLMVLHGLWEHRPTDRFPLISDPVLWVPADSGDVAWTTDKRAGIQRAHELLKDSRVEWFSPADHDVHAQYPERVADILLDAATSGWMK